MSVLAWDQSRAREVDLVMLPPDIQGTNCGNCKFLHHEARLPRGMAYCGHHRVRMHVHMKMCCYFWENPRAPQANPALARRWYG